MRRTHRPEFFCVRLWATGLRKCAGSSTDLGATRIPNEAEYKAYLLDARAIIDAGDEKVRAPVRMLTMTGEWRKVSEYLTDVSHPEPEESAENNEPEEELGMTKHADFADERWVSMEKAEGVEIGDDVKMNDGDVSMGKRGVHTLSGGKQIAVKKWMRPMTTMSRISLPICWMRGCLES